jgi:hypothetical protein
MAFAWFGGQWVAMLLRRRFGERGIGRALGRQRRSASREARNVDILWEEKLERSCGGSGRDLKFYMKLGMRLKGRGEVRSEKEGIGAGGWLASALDPCSFPHTPATLSLARSSTTSCKIISCATMQAEKKGFALVLCSV